MSTRASSTRLRAEQPGAHHQGHRQPDLGDDERLARPAAAHARAPTPCRPGAGRRPGRRARRATPAPGRTPGSPTSEMPRAKASADASTVTSSRRGRSGGASATSAATPTRATSAPAIPAATASTTLSVRSWRTRRARPAPTAARTTISRPRAEARASSRLATLAQAMSRTKPTAPSRTKSVCRVSPTMASCRGVRRTPLSRVAARVLGGEPSGDASHLRAGLGQRDARRQPARPRGSCVPSATAWPAARVRRCRGRRGRGSGTPAR